MKKIYILATAVAILSTVFLLLNSKNKGILVGSGLIQSQPTSVPTPVPTPNAPKNFQFDSSTDLKVELDKVNPQLLDSDFK